LNRVLIYGGLGNQMFQYALCVALNEKGVKTQIEFSGFLRVNHHNGFDLGRALKLKLPFPYNWLKFLLLNCELIYKNKIAIRFIEWYYKDKRNRFSKSYKEKKEFYYDENVFHQHSSILIGVWQAESYFADIKDIIQKRFVFNAPKDEDNRIIIDKISSCNSVSIHIRRGDYLNDRWKEILGIIKDNSYYINAVKLIEEKVENPKYFIFSDDLDWAKENLNLPGSIYIGHNRGKKSYIDMYLMSLCKHNIIANSTFSWWGAWLNKNQNKIVVMPDRWVNTDETPGIFPDGWIKVKTNRISAKEIRL
jgi:hypothetical protein